MTKKLIFENFLILSRLQKNLHISKSKRKKDISFDEIQSVCKDDHSYQFSFSLDIPVSSCEGKHFKRLLLQAVADRAIYLDKTKFSKIWGNKCMKII